MGTFKDIQEEELQQTVLAWDWFDLDRKARKGSYLSTTTALRSVPITFSNEQVMDAVHTRLHPHHHVMNFTGVPCHL